VIRINLLKGLSNLVGYKDPAFPYRPPSRPPSRLPKLEVLFYPQVLILLNICLYKLVNQDVEHLNVACTAAGDKGQSDVQLSESIPKFLL
jgi:hypothetical protein